MNLSVSVKLLSFAAVLLLVSVSASSAAVLFEDNFDNVAVGEAPLAQVGTWARVENVVADTIAAPPSGTQYLEIPRPSMSEGLNDDHWGRALVVPEMGTDLHLECYINAEDSPEFLVQFGLWSVDANPGAWPGSYTMITSLHNSNPDYTNTYTVTNYNFDTETHEDTGLTWTPGVWEKYEIDYVVGESSYQLTLGGNTVTVSPAITPGLVQGIYFVTGHSPGTYGVDNVLFSADMNLIPGDANLDGTVNSADASTLATHWLTLTGATWEMGDFNGDGAVDDFDAAILASNWQVVTSAAVPEPGVISLLLTIFASLTMVRISRQRE